MKLNVKFAKLFVALTALFCPINCYSSWFGPVVILSGGWGENSGQFGILEEDTDVILPKLNAVLNNKLVIIDDQVNNRVLVYDQNNKNIEIINLILKNENGIEYYEIPKYGISNIKRFKTDGSGLIDFGNGAEHLSISGDILATFDKKPLELGIITKEHKSRDKYQTTIQYEDRTYRLTSEEPFDTYVRDQNGFLYGTLHHYFDKESFNWNTRVIRYDPCGKELGYWDKPSNDFVEIPTDPSLPPPPTDQYELLEQYGPPVIGPDGSVYCWKRTPDTYSILKWPWADSPDDPKPGPDAPTNLKLTPSLDGLYLTWDSSPQDPGCVDGYELERATSADGIYTTVTTTDPGVLKFNDTGALSGTNYFYKVRAKGGGEYSPYTVEVSGTKQ